MYITNTPFISKSMPLILIYPIVKASKRRGWNYNVANQWNNMLNNEWYNGAVKIRSDPGSGYVSCIPWKYSILISRPIIQRLWVYVYYRSGLLNFTEINLNLVMLKEVCIFVKYV